MLLFFFKHKTAYDMRISDWSSDVCSSDLGTALYLELAETRKRNLGPLRRGAGDILQHAVDDRFRLGFGQAVFRCDGVCELGGVHIFRSSKVVATEKPVQPLRCQTCAFQKKTDIRSEKHTSELKSLIRIPY